MNRQYISTTPSTRIQDRSVINEMVADFIAKNGEPRQFERGFSSEWEYLQRIMEGYGYKLTWHGRSIYSMRKKGVGGKVKRINRKQLLERVDAVLIENGKQPFGRRDA